MEIEIGFKTSLQDKFINQAKEKKSCSWNRTYIVRQNNHYAVISFNLIERILNYLFCNYIQRLLESKFESKDIKVLAREDLEKLTQIALEKLQSSKKISVNHSVINDPQENFLDQTPPPLVEIKLEENKNEEKEAPKDLFTDLPEELKKEIFSDMHPVRLLKLRTVSKDFKRLCDLRIIDYINEEKCSLGFLPSRLIENILKNYGEKLRYLEISRERETELIKDCPLIEGLVISSWNKNYIDRLVLANPNLKLLKLTSHYNVDYFEEIIDALKKFTQLQELSLLLFNSINNDFDLFAEIESLKKLKNLSLIGSKISTDNLEKLAHLINGSAIETLDLSCAITSNEGFEKFISSLKENNIKKLIIACVYKMENTGLEKLANSPFLQKLEHLDIRQPGTGLPKSHFKFSTLEKIKTSPLFPNLKEFLHPDPFTG